MFFWNIESGAVVTSLAGHTFGITGIIPKADENQIISVSRDGTIRAWDLQHGAEITTSTIPYLGSDGDISPDGQQFVVVSGGNVLNPSLPGFMLLFDAMTGTEIRRFGTDGIAHSRNAGSVRFSPDGQSILSADWGGEIKLWNAADGTLIHQYQGIASAVNSLDFMTDGTAFIAATNEGDVVMGNVASGEIIRRYGFDAPVTKAILTRDASQFLACLADNQFSIVLINIETGQTDLRFTGQTQICSALAFSSDDKMAVSGHVDGNIYLWDVITGQIIRAFTGNRANVKELMFSSDNQTVFSGTFSGASGRSLSLTLWEVATGEPYRRYVGHSRPVDGLDITPDGKTLLSVGYDNTARLWRIDTVDELLAWTRANRYIPDLTCEQRELYRLELLCETTTP
jgi:WD40 repeat protein